MSQKADTHTDNTHTHKHTNTHTDTHTQIWRTTIDLASLAHIRCHSAIILFITMDGQKVQLLNGTLAVVKSS